MRTKARFDESPWIKNLTELPWRAASLGFVAGVFTLAGCLFAWRDNYVMASVCLVAVLLKGCILVVSIRMDGLQEAHKRELSLLRRQRQFMESEFRTQPDMSI